MTDKGKPLIQIGVVAERFKIHPQTLRLYERKGLIRPSRTVGQTRLYSEEDVEELARIIRLTRDLGVNLAGIEIILKMRRQMLEMHRQIEDLLAYIRQEMAEPGARQRSAGEALVRVASSSLKKVEAF